MSGIPTNIITIQFPEGGGSGDPAGGTGGFDGGPMLDVLKGIQINVGSINTNVKAILDVLRRIASLRPSGGAGAAAGAAGRAGGRAPGQPGFAGEILEYRRQIRMGAAFAGIIKPGHAELLRQYREGAEGMDPADLSRAVRLRSVEIMGEFSERTRVTNAARAQAKAQAAEQKKAAADAARAAKMQAREQMRAQSAEIRASRLRMQGGMASRLEYLRMRASMPGMNVAGLGLTDEERAVLSGESSPSGLPGTRTFFRGVRGVVGQVEANAAAEEAPAPGRFSTIAGGVMRIVTTVGRVLAVGGMLIGLVQRIVGMVRMMSQLAMAQRSAFAGLDPVFATAEAQYRIGALKADIEVARNPGVRSAMQGFTNIQLARQRVQIPLRTIGSQTMYNLGSVYESGLMGVEAFFGGLVSGNMRTAGLGFMSMAFASPFMIPFSSLTSSLQSWISSQILGQSRTSSNAMFIDPLVSMTAGRFDVSRPYGGVRNATKDNWWTGRP